ncbi:trifunctional serine/threonine-protein kinase/ATP-binding protein/sensor histidine kinase [Sorangium sp. So ce1024]|uniref:trifunctional serine/threonine-protein kinase/ATP-binding protein/sensor histidine kinase n=1 Tax=Sorangium sp. So ce1024 TaxID=3133327 RepID=UPI003EFC6976
MLEIHGYTLLNAIKATDADVVYRAVRRADGLPVLVKTPAAPHPGPRERERYRREHGTLQRLRGARGVIGVLACELSHDRPALVLERVEGRPLQELTGEPLDVARFLDVAIPLTETLAEIHGHGVIHKDIKPGNIVITPSGEPWIIDFRIAASQKVEHVDAMPTNLIEGTPAYMSPEQTGRMNRAIDHRTDLYSLGVTLYELLTGTLPYHGRDALEWFHAHMAQVPRPPRELVPGLAPALSAIVMKLLSKTADERYQSAEGVKADLVRCRDGLRRGAVEDFEPGARDVSTRLQMPQRLYGREPAVAALLEAWGRAARGGRPELLLVSGYSGIGKSSVVHELHRPVLERRGFFLSGKFDQFQRDVPYATMAQAIRELVQHLLAETDEKLGSFRERLREAWGDNGQVMVDLVPQLELVVGEQPEVQDLPAAEAQNRFNLVFQQFLGVFAKTEHPLVLFLDDLQWTDLATLKLIQHLTTHPDTPPVLLIGAYRDNEVGPSHPLALALDEMRKAGARVSEVHLGPLSPAQSRELVEDALPGAGEDVVAPLAALVHEKTGGNPFFLVQMLPTLHSDGLLRRAPDGGWRWDADGVRARDYSDNVVDFMAGRLRLLPAGTQHLLRLAACMANTFSPKTLAIISGQDLGEVERHLDPALQEGVLVRSAADQVRFLHDRIHQAAYVLTPEDERKAVHLRIGRLLLESLTPEEVRERLFDVVNQLNAAAELMEDGAERHRAARLNAEAGWKAKASAAHQSAISYLTAAFDLLPGDPWETDHELAFKLRLDRASSEFMLGHAAEARRLVDELLERARTRVDKAAVYRLKSDIHVASSENEAAVASILAGLDLFGMHMPAHPSWDEVAAANEEVTALLGDRPVESLLDLPLMADTELKAAMGLLAALFAPSFFTDGNLLVLHLCRMVSLSLRHGNTDAAAQGYTWYGVMAVGVFRKYQQGYAFGKLACDLVERYNFSAYRGKVLYSMEIINYWTRSISISLDLARSAFHHAVLSGDFQVACYCCNHIVTDRISLGHDLADVYRESVARLDFQRKAGFRDVQDITLPAQRFVQQMRGLTRAFDTLDGDGFDEAAFEAALTPDRMSTMRCWYWILKMQSRYMAGAYEEALRAEGRATELIWASLSHIQLLDYHLYRPLTLAARFHDRAPEEQGERLEAMRQSQRELEEWAGSCPENFRAAERMVSAEIARVSGRPDEAMHLYDEAIRSAREHGFIQNVGLANELAARFWRARRLPFIAAAYAREAADAYRQWGADGKVAQLAAEWPELASPAAPRAADAARDTSVTHIDALAVVKAQQAVSGEIVIERLVSTLMRVAIENAGAQRGALLLPKGDTLVVEAVADADRERGGVVVAQGDAGQALPWSIVAYVRRTHEHVLIGDALEPHPFSSDAYLASGRAKSVLCLPLLRKGEFHGALYLENGLTSQAFTPGRIALLEHIASQAAISIENARLYAEIRRAEAALRHANDELEKRVEERTRELKQAQSQVAESARAAGMAEIAANVLHNVGNVLTSVTADAQMMQESLAASRVGRLKQVAAMLRENQGDLAGFLTTDPRGSRLTEYLAGLAGELTAQQEALLGSLGYMQRHIEHIRTIIQVQQLYAKSALFVEECALGEVVENALRIQEAALRRHRVSVTRELDALPALPVDRHKVLQILVNLLANAAEALAGAPEGERRLVVRLRREGQVARIQVVDSGVGIAPEVLPRLFSHGYTTREGGHGFGLHSSALAAKVLGGSLTLKSDGPGKGATATLEIPIAGPGGEPAKGAEPRSRASELVQ